MPGLLTEHPFFNFSLTVAVVIGCTVATGAVVSFTFNYLIREHNIHQVRRQFRRQLKKFQQALRQVEDEIDGLIRPQVEAVRRVVMDSPCKTGEGRLLVSASGEVESPQSMVPSVRFPDQAGDSSTAVTTPSFSRSPSQTSALACSAGGRSVSHPNPTPSSIATPGSKSRSSSLTHLDTPLSVRSKRQRTPSSSPRGSSAGHHHPIAVDAAEKRLKELDEQLLRLLERLDGLKPSELIDDPMLTSVLTGILDAQSLPPQPHASTEQESAQLTSNAAIPEILSVTAISAAAAAAEPATLDVSSTVSTPAQLTALTTLFSWIPTALTDTASQTVLTTVTDPTATSAAPTTSAALLLAATSTDLDTETCDMVISGVGAARDRKRGLIAKIQRQLEEVDRICEVAGVRTAGMATQAR